MYTYTHTHTHTKEIQKKLARIPHEPETGSLQARSGATTMTAVAHARRSWSKRAARDGGAGTHVDAPPTLLAEAVAAKILSNVFPCRPPSPSYGRSACEFRGLGGPQRRPAKATGVLQRGGAPSGGILPLAPRKVRGGGEDGARGACSEEAPLSSLSSFSLFSPLLPLLFSLPPFPFSLFFFPILQFFFF